MVLKLSPFCPKTVRTKNGLGRKMKNITKKNREGIASKDPSTLPEETQKEVWMRAKLFLSPQLLIETLEQYLDHDGLLREYALRLYCDFDLRISFDEQLVL